MATCKSTYFNNHDQACSLLSVVKAEVINDENAIAITFPYPFILLGLADVFQWAGTPPVSEVPMDEYWNLRATAIQETNAQWIGQLFSAMMYANRDVGNYPNSPFLGGVTYEEADMGKWNNYFANKLNAALKVLHYTEFLAAPSLIKRFWTDQLGIANVNTVLPNLLELTHRLHNTTDKRLWMPPGKYIVNLTISEPGNISALLEITNTNVND